MIFYITVLRALAAMLITNSHYTGVYPTDMIANGGLLGDVLFFAVSGFCLVNVKNSFPRWYLKRIVRIYPIVWIITGVYLLAGFYNFNQLSGWEQFLYPTNYHFVASIILLYVPFYAVLKIKILSKNIPIVMLVLFVAELAVYIFFYNKSTYHIDNVREPIIRFMFFQAMLLGAYFRTNKEKYMNKNKWPNWAALALLTAAYFASKLMFVRLAVISPFQILNQMSLFLLLYFILRCFAGIDAKLEKMPEKIKKVIEFIAKLTLEIYVVQIALIPHLTFLTFPLNWLAITASIIILAVILHYVSEQISGGIEFLINKLFPIKSKGDV